STITGTANCAPGVTDVAGVGPALIVIVPWACMMRGTASAIRRPTARCARRCDIHCPSRSAPAAAQPALNGLERRGPKRTLGLLPRQSARELPRSDPVKLGL